MCAAEAFRPLSKPRPRLLFLKSLANDLPHPGGSRKPSLLHRSRHFVRELQSFRITIPLHAWEAVSGSSARILALLPFCRTKSASSTGGPGIELFLLIGPR